MTINQDIPRRKAIRNMDISMVCKYSQDLNNALSGIQVNKNSLLSKWSTNRMAFV